MADEIDLAQQHEELFRELALRVARRHSRSSSSEARRCLDCDEPIDAGRLALVPWATRCLDCQLEAEARKRRA